MINTFVKDRITTLEICHGKVGAMDLELLNALNEAMQEAHDSVALIITGKGRAFSAGVDLFRIVDDGRDYIRDFLAALDRMLETLHHFPRPVIAAINGHAIAGGCVLAAAADERYMADQAGRIGIPELMVGVPFPPLALETMRMALPAPVLHDLIFTGRLLQPEEAKACGLLSGVVPPSDLQSISLQRARTLASLPPESFRLTKESLRRPYLSNAKKASDLETEIFDQWCSPEVHAFIRAYLEKTLGQGK